MRNPSAKHHSNAYENLVSQNKCFVKPHDNGENNDNNNAAAVMKMTVWWWTFWWWWHDQWHDHSSQNVVHAVLPKTRNLRRKIFTWNTSFTNIYAFLNTNPRSGSQTLVTSFNKFLVCTCAQSNKNNNK